MTLPSLPTQGSTSWYDYASDLHTYVDGLSSGGGAVAIADLPAGSVLYVNQNGGGTWPNRPTSRTDIKVIWTKVVGGSADPAAVTSPSLTGAYANDLVVGV